MAAARHVEPERVAIERLGARDVADAQMNVADTQAVRRAGIGRVRRHLAHDVVDVERDRW